MHLLLSTCLISFISFTAPQTLTGCTTKDAQNKTVIIAVNDTVADDSWWYLCVGPSFTAEGCVIDGTRVGIDEGFYAYSNSFYGVCEKIDNKYLRATILGCVDHNGNRIEPGRLYVIGKYFWANCTSTRKIVQSPNIGDVELDVVGRQIIGCNDGTYDIAKDGDNFPLLKTDKPLLAGIGVICRLSGPYPQVEPVVCLVANSSKDQTYEALGDKCFAKFQKFIYYCSIEKRDMGNGTLEYAWEIGWNDYNPDTLAALKAKSYQTCQNQNVQSQNSTAPHSRRKRSDIFQSSLATTLSMIERYDRMHSWLEAPSKYIET